MSQKQKLNKPKKPTRRGYRVRVFALKKNGVNSSLPPPPLPPDPKSAIRFDIKSDEDIVYHSNYKFNIEIEVLINNSTKARGSNTNKTPRRQNAWILYRRDKSTNKEFEGLQTSVVSLKIREMWQKETEEVKEIFSALSRLAEKRHIEQYGKDYKYQPVHMKKSKTNTNKRKVKNNIKLDNCEFFATTLDYFAISASENETMESPPSNNNIEIRDINDTESTSNSTSDDTSKNFLQPIEYDRNDIWQDPMLKFTINDEYSFVNNFIEPDETNEINEKNEVNENNETETYGIFY